MAHKFAGKLGLGGGVGFLVGWLIVWWVEPTTNGGMGLLIIISVVFCATVAAIVSKVLGGKDENNQKAETEKTKASVSQPPGKSSQPSDQWQC